jgi:hypothetical protein
MRVRKERPLSKDKKEQQVNDDDVRNQVSTALDWSEHYIETSAHTKARVDYFERVMHLADPKDLRLRSIRHYGVWLMKMADEKFAAFRWPHDYFLDSHDTQLMVDIIVGEIALALHEVPDTYGGST